MKTKYAVRNPLNGEITYTTKTELPSIIADMILENYLIQTNNSLYSVVQLNIDGSETWKHPNGDELQMISNATNKMLKENIATQIEVTVL